MATRADTNPFETTRATDFTDREILNYWVDLVGHDALDRLLKPSSTLPMLILGSKGSGKTHLLRYCSYSVRKLQWTTTAVDGLAADGYLGIYVHADGLNTNRFSNKGVDPEKWRTVFQYYFESWFARLLIETVASIFTTSNSSPLEERVIARIVDLFDRRPTLDSNSYTALCRFFSDEQKKLDFAINNASFTRELHADILFSPGRLMFGIPEILSSHFGSKDKTPVQVLYLIDELENFSDDQQRFINSLIRYRRGPASLRIGSRLYGVRTYNTGGSGEPIKQDAEFEILPLDSIMRDSKDYPQCVRVLCVKRLAEAGFFPSTSDLRALAKQIDHFFEVPSTVDFHRQETARLVSKYDGQLRPYFERLQRQLESFLDRDGERLSKQIIADLEVTEYPLLEKLNILLLYQAWAKGDELSKAAHKIRDWSKDFQEDPASAPKYRQTLSHYKMDLLAQLYRDSRQRPVYAGLSTFIQMSQGVPRNLLGILKHVFESSLVQR